MRNINDLSKASSCSELSELVQQIGLLPLLDSGITGYSADALVEDDCRYVILPDGGWDWPLWKWKPTFAIIDATNDQHPAKDRLKRPYYRPYTNKEA